MQDSLAGIFRKSVMLKKIKAFSFIGRRFFGGVVTLFFFFFKVRLSKNNSY